MTGLAGHLTTLNNKPESTREYTLSYYQLGWFYNYVVDRNMAWQGGFKVWLAT